MAFDGCKSLTSIDLPQALTLIEAGTFRDCESLESIKIPDGVGKIPYQLFSNCKSLSAVSLPQTLTSIEEEAFLGCESLKSIEIPANVSCISPNAFKNVPLTCVKLSWTIPKNFDYEVFENPENIELYVPSASCDLYRNADYWEWFKKIIPY